MLRVTLGVTAGEPAYAFCEPGAIYHPGRRFGEWAPGAQGGAGRSRARTHKSRFRSAIAVCRKRRCEVRRILMPLQRMI